jgi:hypothetical protein
MFRISPFLRLFSLSLLLGLTSCESTNQLLKAKPAKLSGFIEHSREMRPIRERLPVHLAWSSPDAGVRQRASTKTQIYVAPVYLQYLRPLAKPLVRYEVEHGSITRDEKGMATRLRNTFATTFQRSERPRYLLAQKPNSHSVTLELALVELNPTSPKGNIVKTAAKFVVGPIAGLGGYFTKGNMAIEGKVRNSATGELVFEFADNEADKMTFYSLRDFQPYGHATVAIEEWAKQFELFTRTPPGQKIEESFCFTLNPL